MPETSELSALDADRERRGLTACVMCGYSLRGLPANHRCPECGLAFDKWTEVLTPRAGKGTKKIVIVISIFAGMYMVGIPVALSQAFGVPVGSLVGLILLAAIVAVLLIRGKRRPFLMLGPKGVFFRTRKQAPLLIPWSDVERVETPLPEGGMRDERYLYVYISGQERPCDLSGVVKGVGFADRAKGRIMALRDLRLGQVLHGRSAPQPEIATNERK